MTIGSTNHAFLGLEILNVKAVICNLDSRGQTAGFEAICPIIIKNGSYIES